MSDIETQLQQRPTIQVVSSLRVEVIDGPDRGNSITGGDLISVGTARDNVIRLLPPYITPKKASRIDELLNKLEKEKGQ